jgi:hypothetical protein
MEKIDGKSVKQFLFDFETQTGIHKIFDFLHSMLTKPSCTRRNGHPNKSCNSDRNSHCTFAWCQDSPRGLDNFQYDFRKWDWSSRELYGSSRASLDIGFVRCWLTLDLLHNSLCQRTRQWICMYWKELSPAHTQTLSHWYITTTTFLCFLRIFKYVTGRRGGSFLRSIFQGPKSHNAEIGAGVWWCII